MQAEIALGRRRTIEVAPNEPFGGNSLRVGDRLLYAAGQPATANRLEKAGFAVELLDISEFAKAEAGLTCLSVLIPRPD